LPPHTNVPVARMQVSRIASYTIHVPLDPPFSALIPMDGTPFVATTAGKQLGKALDPTSYQRACACLDGLSNALQDARVVDGLQVETERLSDPDTIPVSAVHSVSICSKERRETCAHCTRSLPLPGDMSADSLLQWTKSALAYKCSYCDWSWNIHYLERILRLAYAIRKCTHPACSIYLNAQPAIDHDAPGRPSNASQGFPTVQ
jgi:hypothetical protein